MSVTVTHSLPSSCVPIMTPDDGVSTVLVFSPPRANYGRRQKNRLGALQFACDAVFNRLQIHLFRRRDATLKDHRREAPDDPAEQVGTHRVVWLQVGLHAQRRDVLQSDLLEN